MEEARDAAACATGEAPPPIVRCARKRSIARAGDPHAELRAGRATIRCSTRTRRASFTSKRTRQRARARAAARPRRRVDQPAADPADDAGDGRALRAAVLAAAAPAPSATTKLPAYEMIKFSVTILRGCFGGCSFCSITEHEGRIIQSRSETSILREIERIRDVTPGFTGNISDLGGPTANMYRMACKTPRDRGGVPQAVVRVSRHLRQPRHRPRAAGRALPQGARDPGRQADLHRVGRALRPRGALARNGSRSSRSTTPAAI